jgi:hypothetical protein
MSAMALTVTPVNPRVGFILTSLGSAISSPFLARRNPSPEYRVFERRRQHEHDACRLHSIDGLLKT